MPSPLDLADLPFLRDALFEVLLLAGAGGLLSAWIVLRRLAFFSHAVGSATFPGLVVADASGFSPLLAGLARALGLPAARADFALLALVAVAAVAAIPAVGALLVAAIYVLPGAGARLIARTVPALLGWSVALALAEGLAGL